MALRLRQRGYEPPGTSHVPTVATDQWRDRAFVGRGSQYRVAYERWEQTGGGQGRHVLLLGDSGIGKTTLTERLVTAAGLEGAVSSRVQCYEVEREIPYAAIGTLVRGMLDRPGASGTPPEWLAELARTVPAVRQRYANLPPPRETEGEAARLRLTEAVHQLATSIAEEHPLILVVDDVHLSDDASVAVLHLLMRRTQEQRIMIVLTAREPELARSPHASRLMEVRRALALEPVDVPPLTDEEMGQVVTALADAVGKTLPPAVRRALLRASAGIPMVAEMLFDDWRTHGDQCLALAIGAMTVDAQGDNQKVFHQLLDRVFQNLSPVARAVLNLAAILGDRLNDLSMYELADLTLAQTLSGMSELTSLRILRDGGREMEFRNEMLRGYAYFSVPSPLRRALHGLIADRLLAAEAGGEAIPGLMLAWHCYRAGRVEQAEPYLLRGSREAMNRGAAFETELALQSAMGGLKADALIRAKILFCGALQEQGRWVESLDSLQSGGDWPVEFLKAKKALEINARACTISGAHESTQLLEEVVVLLDSNLDAEWQTPAFDAVSRLVWYLGGEHDELLQCLERLYSAASELSSRAALTSAILTMAWATKRLNRFAAFHKIGEDIGNECEAVGLVNSSRFSLENTRSCLAVVRGNYAESLKYSQVAFTIAKRMGDDQRVCVAATNTAMSLGRLGRYREQEEWARQSVCLSQTVPQKWRLNRARFYVAWALAMSGNTKAALEEIYKYDLGRYEVPLWWAQAVGLLRADILEVCGEHNKAVHYASDALAATGIEPLSGDYVGTIARWIAHLSIEGLLLGDGHGVLERLVGRVDELDMLDQAEVLAAWRLLRRHDGLDTGDCDKQLVDRLGKLPPAVEQQFKRLGVLQRPT
jgi:tetratricopeptide (TPR) repeat protein